MQENHYLVPPQPLGNGKDMEQSITADTVDDAEYDFVDAKDRLLDVNSWNKYCAALSTEFRLTDIHGLGISRHARKGDLVRIGTSGNNSTRPNEFDWVRIEAIEYDDYPDMNIETFALHVRAVQDPLIKHAPHITGAEHAASFTFVIERRGSKLFASYHERASHESAAEQWPGLADEECLCLLKGILG